MILELWVKFNIKLILVRLDYLDNDVIGILFGFRLPNLQANT